MGENVEQGRNADILQSIVDDVPYTDPPQSRIEDLLLQVKEVIEEGGGGGGDVTSVNGKTGAVTLTASDVGAYTTAETDALLADKQSETLSASVKIGTETETTVEGAIGEVAAIIPATAAVSNKLSTAADTAKEDITATANSEDIALTDSADARVHDLRIYGKNAPSKNKLVYSRSTIETNGITFTAVQDTRGYTAKVIANGTATANAAFTVTFNQDKTYPAGCILTGCPQGGAQSTYYIGVSAFGTGNLLTADYGYGSVFSTDMPDRITIYIKSGQTVNNLVFEPMIRDPNTNDVFQPYFTGERPVGVNGISVKSDAIGKNLFNINGSINAFYQTNGDKENFTSAGKNKLSDGKIVAYRNFDAQKLVGQFINVKAGEVYTISAIATGFESPTRGAISIGEWYNGAFVQEALYLPTAGARAYKSYRAKTDTLCIGFGSSGQSSGVTFDQIQLEKGWVPTEYEQYKTFSSDLTITTALPLRGSYKTIDLGDYDWWYQTSVEANDPASVPRFATTGKIFDAYIPSVEFGVAMSSCSSRYTPAADPVLGGNTDKTICFGKGKGVYVVDHEYTDAAAFKAAVTGITLTYPSYCDEIDLADGVAITRLDSNGDVLATPVTTPLTTAEKAAFAEFRTFDGNTNVTATDDPFMTLNYVKNTENGKALADVDNKSAVRIAMIAAPYDDTATYAVGNYCTYGDRLWKCNTAIGTAEPFTAAHWTATTVMEEI